MNEPDLAKSNTITAALKHFETVEANLVKLERLWAEISNLIPTGPAFVSSSEYDEKCMSFNVIQPYLPKIDGWQPEIKFLNLNDIGQTRLDYLEIDEPIASFRFDEEEVMKPGSELSKYRFLLNQNRRKLIRDELLTLIKNIDSCIPILKIEIEKEESSSSASEQWQMLSDYFDQIDTLLGSTVRPSRWNDMRRHLNFSQKNDAYDIEHSDWPTIRQGLIGEIYADNDPMPVEIEDIAILVEAKPSGPIPKKLHWERLSPEDFERLIFSLLTTTPGYQNCAWLTKTKAPDKGRDLSVELITQDLLSGPSVSRIIIQCKHYLSSSISIDEVATLQAQMKLWQPPVVDVCIIATSGRFTTDAIVFIEKENQSDNALKIKMWPESHIESLLASRPSLIAEFGLR